MRTFWMDAQLQRLVDARSLARALRVGGAGSWMLEARRVFR
jgi:hypothetical protein